MCGVRMRHVHAGAASWTPAFGLSYIVRQEGLHCNGKIVFLVYLSVFGLIMEKCSGRIKAVRISNIIRAWLKTRSNAAGGNKRYEICKADRNYQESLTRTEMSVKDSDSSNI